MSFTQWQPITRPPCRYCGYPADPGERLCERCLPACDVRAWHELAERVYVCPRCAARVDTNGVSLCRLCVLETQGLGAESLARRAALAGAREAAKHIESQRRAGTDRRENQ